MNILYDPVKREIDFGFIRREMEAEGSLYAIISHPTLDGFMVYLSKKVTEKLRWQDNQVFDRPELTLAHYENIPLVASLDNKICFIWLQLFEIQDSNYILLSCRYNARQAKVIAELEAAIIYNPLISLAVTLQ